MNVTNKLTEKYRELIGAILKTDAFTLYKIGSSQNPKARIPYDFVEVYHKEGEPDTFAPFYYSHGLYELTLSNGKRVASFELVPMVNCCGILISTRARVEKDFQHSGLGGLLNNLRMDIARELGYSVLLCTDVLQNEYQRKILARNGWRDIFRFVNKRTQNTVMISIVNL